MTKMFGNLSTDGVSDATDRTGSRGPFDANLYDATIKLAYGGHSAGGAANATIHLEIDGREHRETIYFTKKTGETFYMDKDGKTKQPMPGFTILNDLCLMASEIPLLEQEFEEKVINLWNYEAKKEIPTTVQMMTGILNQKVKVGLLKEIDDKNAKGSDGVYRPTGEKRTSNRIDKVFHPETSKTIPEYRANIEEAVFVHAWTKQNAGQTRDISKGAEGKSGAPGGSSGMFGAAGAQAAKPASSGMFGR